MSTITQSHLVTQQQYADDTQLHISFSPSELSGQLNTQSCLAFVDSWLCENGLALNGRIEYKLLSISLTYKVLITTQPSYLHNLLSLQTPRSTRSSSVVTLAHQPALHWKSQITHLDMHHLVFGINFQIHFVSLITRFNSPPHAFVNPSLSPSPLSSSITPSLFQYRLKTYLFNKSFPP